MKRYQPVLCLLAALIATGVVGDEKEPKPGKIDKFAPKPPGEKMVKPSKMPPDGAQPPMKTKTGALVEDAHPKRDPFVIATAVDRLVEAALEREKLPASPQADDAEFLRRVTIDLIGRIPTTHEARAFLDDRSADKRARWIDALLASPAYGEHFGTMWRELIMPPEHGIKGGRDTFTPWLAEQFNRNRGWDRLVMDMLVIEGRIRELPQTAFVMACSDNGEPQPNMLADATSRLFWGVQLRCAECHDHPFAPWKQEDFWGVAAFFTRTRKGADEGKNPLGWTVTEAALKPDENWMPPRKWTPEDAHGAVVRAPDTSGKAAGRVFKAKFLGGDEVPWQDDGPYRQRFAEWAVSARNPWFATNMVNRLWAHFFTRGLVTPLDGFNGDQIPTHPELLAGLARELVASEFDLKHLVRCVCNSRAYQRGSRVLAENARDEKWLSHHPVRVMRPEVLYNSISVAMRASAPKNSGKPGAGSHIGNIDRAQPIPGVPREDFTRFYGSRPGDNEGSLVNQGIPQLLRLMNGALLNGGSPESDWPPPSSKNIKGDAPKPKDVMQKMQEMAATDPALQQKLKLKGQGDASGMPVMFVSDGTSAEDVYLAAYSRLPTEEERAWLAEFTAGHASPKKAAEALLWTLLNSAEFVTNH